MAIDSREERSSALNFGDIVPHTLPTPDGDVDIRSRAHLLGLVGSELISPALAAAKLKAGLIGIRIGNNQTAIVRI